MLVETRPVGPFAMNTYVVACPATRRAALVDAGGELDWVEGVIESNELELVYLLQTHAHIDHVAALPEAREAFPDAPIVLHADDMPLYENAHAQGAMFGLRIAKLPAVEQHVQDGDTIELGELTFDVMHVPGHAPGQVAFIEHDQSVALSGDLLFAGSIGRTDLPGCDPQAMVASLKRFTQELPGEMQVLSGHGPATTIGRELERNPFLRPGGLL